MKKLLVFSSLLLCAVLSAGMFEDFVKDFDFAVEKCSAVENLPSGSPYRKEFNARLSSLQQNAAEIQRVAVQIGIPNVILQSSVNNFCRTITTSNSVLEGKKSDEVKDTREFFIRDVNDQIRMLQELSFSYEEKTFEMIPKYAVAEDGIVQFSKLYKECSKYALSKKTYSSAASQEIKKRWFQPAQRLAREIDKYLKTQKIELPASYNLSGHMDSICSRYNQILDFVRKDRKDSARYSTGLGETASLADIRKEIQLLDQSITRDLEILLEKKVDLRMSSGKNKGGMNNQRLMTGRETEKRKKDEAKAAEAAAAESSVLSQAEYKALREKAFSAESRMNGVSEEYFENYKKLLPAAQLAELETALKKFDDDGYPPAFARSEAVTRIHRKYENTACSQKDLAEISARLAGQTQGELK